MKSQKPQGGEMILNRIFEMPNIYTFKMPKLRKFVLDNCSGNCLNVFGGIVRLEKKGVNFVHNDLNYHLSPAPDCSFDAMEIDKHFPENSFDTIILDPPYSMYQAIHSYKGIKCQDITRVKDAVNRLLKVNGIIITLGWNSTGMCKNRGFVIENILLVNSGGSHNDIIIVVERKIFEQKKLKAELKKLEEK